MEFSPRSRNNRRTIGVTVAGLTLLGAASLLPLPAAGQTTGTVIFRGDPPQVSGITTSSWGSGTVTEDKQAVYAGGQSFKITTQGLYQGGSFSFAKPFDLAPYVTNKNAYLELAILPPPREGTGTGRMGGRGGFPGGPGGPGGFPGGPGGFPGGPGGFPGGPGGGLGGGRGAGGAAGGRNNTNRRQLKMQTPRTLANLRVVLLTNTDKQLEFLMPLASGRDDNNWRLLHIPVSGIPGLEANDTQIKAMRVFGDVPSTFYLGQVRVLIDATPITIDPISEKVVPRRESYRYTVTAHAGATPLKYSWDFDEADGIQEEGTGRTVVHAYPKAGDYIASVTVSDLYGLKKPAVLKFKVHVTP